MEISLRQLTRVSATRTILQAIDLDFLGPGVNAVIGPNGAGKTSLLRLLALLEKPSSGEIRADGRPLTHLNSQERTAWRRRIGFVFQTPLLFRGTVQQNLLFGLKARGRSLSAAGIENLLGQVGLTQRNRQDVRQLSGGEKQRLQLARVLAFDPELYLLDEPTANLDPLSTKRIEAVISELSAAGKTIILATHNLFQARTMGQKLFFLREGKLLQEGSPEQLFSMPHSLEVAEFSQVQNIIAGRLERQGDAATLTCHGVAIEAISDLQSGPAVAVIRPEDILLSEQPLRSTARNCLAAAVTRIDNLGAIFAVSAASGELTLTALVTKPSLQAMGLVKGSRVYLTFKTTAVHVLPES